MRLKCIGCEVLARPIYLAAARSPHIVDVEILRRGLHDTPPQLRAQLQGAIDALGPQTRSSSHTVSAGPRRPVWWLVTGRW